MKIKGLALNSCLPLPLPLPSLSLSLSLATQLEAAPTHTLFADQLRRVSVMILQRKEKGKAVPAVPQLMHLYVCECVYVRVCARM